MPLGQKYYDFRGKDSSSGWKDYDLIQNANDLGSIIYCLSSQYIDHKYLTSILEQIYVSDLCGADIHLQLSSKSTMCKTIFFEVLTLYWKCLLIVNLHRCLYSAFLFTYMAPTKIIVREKSERTYIISTGGKTYDLVP